MKFSSLVLMATAVMALAGCGSNPPLPDEQGLADASQTANDGDGALVTPAIVGEGEPGVAIDPNSIAGRAPQERIIFFDFDESDIREEYRDTVIQHSRFLAQNPEARVRLEGHTDERGTREYNIALGEARARSLARVMLLQGVKNEQVRAISYGEELPVDEGHTPEAWAKNRRVNIIYEAAVPN